MAISAHLTEWLGHPLVDFNGTLDDPRSRAYALRVGDDDESFEHSLGDLLEASGSEHLESLVVGTWSDEMYDCSSALVVEALCAQKARLPNLKRLFVGEITYEEFEISWIVQSDLSPLLQAFPALEWLTVRGGTSLSFSDLKHDNLKGLVVESGGLARGPVAQILAGKLPALEHLELWLGASEYGGDTTVDDFEALLGDRLFPKLRRLGLCNSEYSDDIVAALAKSAVLDRIEELDLSRGTLGDAGAEPLLRNARFSILKSLDLRENFLTPGLVSQLAKALPKANLAEQRDLSEFGGERYCSVSE